MHSGYVLLNCDLGAEEYVLEEMTHADGIILVVDASILEIAMHDSVMVVIGAEKVPRDVYDMADYNVSVGSQPHSEIAALAVVLDRVQEGKQFDAEFENAEHKIVPTERGKNVV